MEQSITSWDYIYLSQGEKPPSKTEKWNSSPAFCSPWRCFERIAVAEKVHKALPHLLSNQGHLLRSPSGIKICKVLIVVFSHLRILVLFPLDMRFHSSIIFLAYYISEKLKKKKKKRWNLFFHVHPECTFWICGVMLDCIFLPSLMMTVPECLDASGFS